MEKPMQTITDNQLLPAGNYVKLHWFGSETKVLIAKRNDDGSLVNAGTGDPITDHSLRSWFVGEPFTVN